MPVNAATAGIVVADIATRHCQGGGAELEAAITDWITNRNANPKPFVWTKTADQILAKIARFAHATLEDHDADRN